MLALSPAGSASSHLDDGCTQHQARLNVAHGSFGAALAAGGNAVDGGAAVVLLEALGQREAGCERGPSRHLG